MMEQDWLDKLKALRQDMPADESESETGSEQQSLPSDDNTARLDIIFEKKGRAGKTATIITGWNGSEEGLLELASTLKRRLATGGSARGGEILIQGDRRQQVKELLSALGHKCRVI